MELRNKHGRLLLFDLHGYGSSGDPFLSQFDLVLGTRYRQTTLPGDIDNQLGLHMQSRGYRIHIPGTEPVPGERFGALKLTTLMGILSSNGLFPAITAMQLEIASQHRNGDLQLRKKLAESLGDFLLQWRRREN